MVRRIAIYVVLGIVGAISITIAAGLPGPGRVSVSQGSRPSGICSQATPCIAELAASGASGCCSLRKVSAETELDESLPSCCAATNGLQELAANPIDRQLEVVSELLDTKAELTPSEQQIKDAIGNYFLNSRVEAAIGILSKIADEAPESIQGQRAKSAVDVLKGSQTQQPAEAAEIDHFGSGVAEPS